MNKNTKSLRVPALGMITHYQMQILEQLINQDDAYGGAWCNLDHVHGRSLNSLQKRDWIQRSPRPIGDRYDYKITSRGRKAFRAYQEYEPRSYRLDGICPRCNERPKLSSKDGYCRSCRREARNEWSQKQDKYYLRNVGKMCYRCGKRPIRNHTICRVCHNKEMRERRLKIVEEIRNGERDVPICNRCGIRPRRVGDEHVATYCSECSSEYYKQNYRKRLARKKRKAFERILGKR